MTRKQWAGVAVVTLAAGVLTAEYLRAAQASFAATRATACRALRPDPVPPSLVGKPAPDFTLADSKGRQWSLSSLRGRPVLLNFWATWCPPCVDEMPSMEELGRIAGDRAVILAVSVDEDWDTVKRFFPGGTRLSVLLDANKDVAKRYGTEKFPETFLIDSQGVVRQYFISKRKWDEAESLFCLQSAQ